MHQNLPGTVFNAVKNILRDKSAWNAIARPELFRPCSYHTGPTEPPSQTKDFLRDYKGGSVDLEKKENGIATIVLNHPERRNALSGKMLAPKRVAELDDVIGSMMADLMDIAEELENWEDGVGFILRGAENKSNIFCSGGDLTTVERISGSENGFRMSVFMNDVTARLAALPLVSVCMLQGAAVGGGAELTTLTDFRVVSEEASVSFVQGRMGVAPGWGGARRLVDLLGRRKALELMLTCSKVGAEEGRRLGYFDLVLTGGQTLAQTETWLEGRVGGLDRSVVRSLKKMTVNRDQEAESRIFAPLWGGPANKAALERNLKHR